MDNYYLYEEEIGMEKTKAQALRDNVIAQMIQYEEQLRMAGMNVEADQIADKIKEYMKGLFSVMFTGGFNAGKSTTLNALMRQQLLTVSINPETPVITKIVNGEDSDKAVIKYRDMDRPDEIIPLAEFGEKYRLEFQNEEKFTEVSYVELKRRLRNPTVIFVDSPGLGNTTTDDRTAGDFAKKADAIVFVMHATQAMDQKEKEYVEKNFRRRQLKNVFFVVNWYNMVQEQDEEKFRAKLKHDLEDVFTDGDGNFDQKLYDSRVFCIDALISFCARTGIPKRERKGIIYTDKKVEPEEDAYTGVPEFEKALYEFLGADDRDIAGYKGFMPRMAGMLGSTSDHMAEILELGKSEVKELESKKEKQQAAIDEIIRNLDGMNQALDMGMREMLVNVQSAYQNFLTSSENNWDNYFKGKKIDFGILDEGKIFALKAKHRIQDIFDPEGADQMARDKEFEGLMKPIIELVEAYIQSEVEKMVNKIIVNSEPVIQRLVSQLQGYAENIKSVKLDGFDFQKLVADVVAAGQRGTESAAKRIRTKAEGATDPVSGDMSIIQALISGALLFNFDDMITTGVEGKKPWGTFIKENLMKEMGDYILAFVVASIFPPAWIYYAARAIWGIISLRKNASGIGNQIILGMKGATVQSIADSKEEITMKIEAAFEQELVYKSGELTGAIELEMRQKQKQLQDLIDDIRSGQFDYDEKAALFEKIKKDMVLCFNKISELLGDKTYSEEEILTYAIQK